MDAIDKTLYERTRALLEPGDIELNGIIIHTDLESDQEAQLHQATLDIGEIISNHADVGETYVYSGNDDPEFGLNQHQGLTIAGDEFVWECQQLLRDETYVIVFYYESSADQEAIVSDTGDDFRVTSVEGE
jgi:hypothetical protein